MINERYDSLFKFYARSDGVNWILLKAQATAESNLDPVAVSPVGCKGLSQFADGTFAELVAELKIPKASVWNPEHSIQCQSRYMKKLLAMFDNDWDKAIAAYNWGMGNVRRVVEKYGLYWRLHLPVETMAYIDRINKLMKERIN